MNPITLLRRTDAWHIGGGNRLIWAPEFPVHLDAPGFWDRAHYYNLIFEPVFTWTLLDENGKEIRLQQTHREWSPASVKQTYRSTVRSEKIALTEENVLLPADAIVSSLVVRSASRKKRNLRLVVWTAQERSAKGSTDCAEVKRITEGLQFIKTFRPQGRPERKAMCTLQLSGARMTHAAQLSEGKAPKPEWNLTPWFGMPAADILPNSIFAGDDGKEGILYLGVSTLFSVTNRNAAEIHLGLSVVPHAAEAQSPLQSSAAVMISRYKPVELSRLHWKEYFEGVPDFRCDDKYFENHYWHRYYGLRLNTQYGGDGNYRRPVVCEGVGYFRAPISYSAPCHIRENRWLEEWELAEGSLLTFIDHQRADGGFRGYIDPDGYRTEMFYHADWGTALMELHSITQADEFLESVYPGISRYAEYFDRERDPEGSGMYDITNHYETGQEYMHRYVAVEPEADRQHWGNVFRLKGIDVTVYIYTLKRALAFAAERLGKETDAEAWKLGAEKIRKAVREKMWDADEEMFFDVDPDTGRRTRVKAAVCFYPYYTDIADDSHLPGLRKHLFNPRQFWTPYPVPSSSVDDEFFNAEPVWKGKRMNCPWNGRVWPMTNSHIAEAIAQSAVRAEDSFLRKKAVEFITKYIRMMFWDGNATMPNSFEHYHPYTGTPSAYRGIDNYMHSWTADLILKYVCGIRPTATDVVIDPFPFGVKCSVSRVTVHGRRLSMRVDEKEFEVTLDGTRTYKSAIGKPIILQV